jgi:hypothetical protein
MVMATYFIEKTRKCNCEVQEECEIEEHAWNVIPCCETIESNGELFYVASDDNIHATGLEMDTSGQAEEDDELVKVIACPFCGARVLVVDELPNG